MRLRNRGSGAFLQRGTMTPIAYRSLLLTAAEFNTLGTTPMEIVRAPGPGMVLLPIAGVVTIYTTGHTPFTGGNDLIVGVAGSNVFYDWSPFSLTQSVDWISSGNPALLLDAPLAPLENQPWTIGTSGIDFTGGAGSTVLIELWYTISNMP